MAKVKQRHKLEGFGGQIGRHLVVSEKGHVSPTDKPHPHPHWDVFKDAVAYAREAKGRHEYEELAEAQKTTAFKVATADFLHPPEIHEIDLSDYHGHRGDVIRVHASDDVKVAEVGILITDHENCLVEMGMARADHGDVWQYQAQHEAPGPHVRVIVDAADLPGHVAEGRKRKAI